MGEFKFIMYNIELQQSITNNLVVYYQNNYDYYCLSNKFNLLLLFPKLFKFTTVDD